MVINWLLAFVISLMYFYSFIYAGDSAYPIKCYYEIHFHRQCPTCGLSRGFSAIMRGEFKKAAGLNQNAIPLFCFFSIELLARLLINLLLINLKQLKQPRWMLVADILGSTFLFVFTFHRLILNVMVADNFI